MLAEGSLQLRVYVVDDEPLALRNLVQMLEKSDGVELLGHSTDPQEAVHFLSAHPVDLLFLDIHMPGLSGFSLLARLQKPPAVVLRPPTMSMPGRHSAPMRSITCRNPFAPPISRVLLKRLCGSETQPRRRQESSA